MKQDFLDYIKKEFNFSAEEFKKFEKHLEKPLKKALELIQIKLVLII